MGGVASQSVCRARPRDRTDPGAFEFLLSDICSVVCICVFFFSSRRRHTRYIGDWSSDVCSSDLSMEIPSSQAGVVKELRVKVGDKVSEGSVLLTIEAAEGAQAVSPPSPGEGRKIGRASCRERV